MSDLADHLLATQTVEFNPAKINEDSLAPVPIDACLSRHVYRIRCRTGRMRKYAVYYHGNIFLAVDTMLDKKGNKKLLFDYHVSSWRSGTVAPLWPTGFVVPPDMPLDTTLGTKDAVSGAYIHSSYRYHYWYEIRGDARIAILNADPVYQPNRRLIKFLEIVEKYCEGG